MTLRTIALIGSRIESIQNVLADMSGIEVIDLNLAEPIKKIDVVIIDFSMSISEGVGLIESANRINPEVKIICISPEHTKRNIANALDCIAIENIKDLKSKI